MVLNMSWKHLLELKTVIALPPFEHMKTQQLVAFKCSVYILFSLSTPNTFFTYFYMCIYIGEPVL